MYQRQIRLPPFGLIFALFLAVPLIEIYLLIKIGSHLGALMTIGVVILTAFVGALLLRVQGLSTLAKVQDCLARGELPAVELVEGLILLITGALLLTPGFFTDGLGFVLLLPAARERLARWLLQRIVPPPPPPGSAGDGRTIEGEYWRND